MLKPKCPKCQRVIPSDDVNPGTDVAFCRSCNIAYQLSELVRGVELDGVNLGQPPPGAWLRSSATGVEVGATHRSLGTAFGALAFSLFWNGIVSIFVAIAIGGTMRNLDIPVPEWFPAPVMNGSPMSVGMTVFLWMFLTPFIVIGAVMLGALFSSLAGRTEVRIHRGESVVFTGIGAIGWSRRFDPGAVKVVRLNEEQWRGSKGGDHTKTQIVIEMNDGKAIKCGSMLREDRRKFVAAAVRKYIALR